MAYFSNGSDNRLISMCEDCLHEDPDAGCPIAYVHLTYNYDQLKNVKLQECLNALINEKGECLMRPYVMELKSSPKPDKETLNIFEKNRSF